MGFHYYEDEDRCIFWSNDPSLTIADMVRSLGLAESHAELQRIQSLYDQAGVPK